MAEEVSKLDLDLIRGLSFSVDSPDSLARGDWRPMQGLATIAVGVVVSLRAHIPEGEAPPAPERYLVEQNIDTFIRNRKQPETAPGLPGQLFGEGHVVRATDAQNKLIAYSYSVDNTSAPLAKVKMAVPPAWPIPMVGGRKYRKINELFVHPDYWDKGIGSMVAYKTLSLAPKQPVAAYIYPREFPHMLSTFRRYSMQWTGQFPYNPYGEAGKATNMVRFTKDARVLMSMIEAKPGATEALAIMNANTRSSSEY